MKNAFKPVNKALMSMLQRPKFFSFSETLDLAIDLDFVESKGVDSFSLDKGDSNSATEETIQVLENR